MMAFLTERLTERQTSLTSKDLDFVGSVKKKVLKGRVMISSEFNNFNRANNLQYHSDM